MILIAIEPSTRINSITLSYDNAIIATSSWDEREVERQYLFSALPALLDEHDIPIGSVDQFVIGSGPGSFSGIRIAIAACQGLAHPSGARVSCIPSTEVTARQVVAAQSPVLVVGDARRKKLWCAEYGLLDDRLVTRQEPHLIDVTALADYVTPQTLVASPDYDRIADRLEALEPTGADVMARPVTPSAEDLVRLTQERLAQGETLAPPVPTYLHPAVFVAPRFPVTPADKA